MSTRLFSLAICAFLLSPSLANAQQGTAPAATPKPASTNAAGAKAPDVKVDASSKAIAEAMVCMQKNDFDGAIAKLTEAIQANPKIAGPYVFRASVYYQKKDWAKAEADFNAAAKIDPTNVVIKFNLIEMKFAQKQYEAARADYATLTGDKQLGDLAAYKVFLCDLLMKKDDLAKKERDAFDVVNVQPSRYFSMAAWYLVHKDPEGARSWLVSAANIFPSARISNYAIPLRDLGYLPLPPSVTGN